MQHLRSIQTADRYFDTNRRPVLITCSDMESYVCKYHTGSGNCMSLFCEYLASSFLKIWGLRTPDSAFVRINREHIPSSWGIHGYCFDTTCFATKYNSQYADATKLNEIIKSSDRKKYTNGFDLIKIGLFDLWLANEDRRAGNMNLLIDLENERDFIAIDHGSIFNSGVMNSHLSELTENESILDSLFARTLFSKKEITPILVDEMKKYFYLRTQHCKEQVPSILDEIPSDWKISRDEVNTTLEQVFAKQWQEDIFLLFSTLLQSYLL